RPALRMMMRMKAMMKIALKQTFRGPALVAVALKDCKVHPFKLRGPPPRRHSAEPSPSRVRITKTLRITVWIQPRTIPSILFSYPLLLLICSRCRPSTEEVSEVKPPSLLAQRRFGGTAASDTLDDLIRGVLHPRSYSQSSISV